jgi:hypothetical protein
MKAVRYLEQIPPSLTFLWRSHISHCSLYDFQNIVTLCFWRVTVIRTRYYFSTAFLYKRNWTPFLKRKWREGWIESELQMLSRHDADPLLLYNVPLLGDEANQCDSAWWLSYSVIRKCLAISQGLIRRYEMETDRWDICDKMRATKALVFAAFFTYCTLKYNSIIISLLKFRARIILRVELESTEAIVRSWLSSGLLCCVVC